LPAGHDDVAPDSVAHVADDDFEKLLEPPDEYDPFGISKPIPRAQTTGPVEPLLDSPNPVPNEPVEPPVKIPYWDRPKQPRDWYWFLGRLGSGLIILGLLMFLFVGYQLWGTGIEEAQSQNRLEDSFAELVARVDESPDSTPDTANPDTTNPDTTNPTSPTTTVAATPEPTEPTETREPIDIVEGDPVAIIELPTINVKKFVVAGVQTADLKKGPGHYPDTPFPGELGNAAIAGHRTTYGEPFRQLDELQIGDEIKVTDLFGREFVYRVTGTQIVGPADSWVVATTDPTVATLTLTTCHPEFSAKQRLIVSAELDLAVSAPVDQPAAAYPSRNSSAPSTTATPEPTSTVSSSVVSSSASTTSVVATVAPTTTVPVAIEDDTVIEADIFESGWFSDGAAWPHVLAWIALELLVVWAAWRVAKRLRNRLIGAAVGFVPFFVVLYFVFQNVNRLLPPNL
jgi:sortase A